MTKKNFKLFSSCILVNGYSMDVIVDTERGDIYDIPKPLSEMLKALNATSYEEFISSSLQKKSTIDGIIDQFITQELAFFTDSPDSFPDIDLSWDSPFKVSNAVIHVNDLKRYNLYKTINDIEKLGCQYFQVIIESNLNALQIEKIIQTFSDTRVKSVELIMPMHNLIKISELKTLIHKEPRISFIILYGSDKNKVIESYNDGRFIEVQKKDIRIDKSEIISLDRFSKNLETYAEAQKHNTGLNKKITIDSKGNIKNYSTHSKIFGNVNTHVIEDIIDNQDFRKNWFINNDMIEKCKICQYRYVCVSNSDIEIKENSYYKKDTCTFNPKINTWD